MNTYRIFSKSSAITFEGNFFQAMQKAKETSLVTRGTVWLEKASTGKGVYVTHKRVA